MFACPFCGDRVALQSPQCPRCGIAVRWQGDVPDFEDPGDIVTLVKVFNPTTQPLIESLLETAGIPYVVQTDVMQDVMGLGRLAGGYNQIFGPPVIQVPKGMLDAAREAIAVVLDEAAVPPSEDELPDEEGAPTPE